MTPQSLSACDHTITLSTAHFKKSVSERKRLGAATTGRMRRWMILVLLSCIVSSSFWAQEPGGTPSGTAQEQKSSGTVSGYATDPAHSALQGARVELQPTGITAVSDNEGLFTIQGVPVGTYTISVSYLGFSPFSTSITVTGGQPTQVDALLQIGSVNQEVVVRGEREHGEIEALNIERT